MLDHMVTYLQQIPANFNITITEEQYLAWQQHYLFEAVKGKRYGLSFCEYFELTDYILMFSDPDEADAYIKRTYIK